MSRIHSFAGNGALPVDSVKMMDRTGDVNAKERVRMENDYIEKRGRKQGRGKGPDRAESLPSRGS
jgi:hypothetical protein